MDLFACAGSAQSLPVTATPRDAVAVIQQRGFSRVPVYSQRETNIVGVVAAMDLLRRGASAKTLDELIRQPYYVPETKRIDDLLRQKQRGEDPGKWGFLLSRR